MTRQPFHEHTLIEHNTIKVKDKAYRFINRSCMELDPDEPSAFPFSILSITLPLTRDSASCDRERMWARLPPELPPGEDEEALAPALLSSSSWLVTRITGMGSSRLAMEKPLSSMLGQ